MKSALWIGIATALLGEMQFGFSLGVLNPSLKHIKQSLDIPSESLTSLLVTVLVAGAALGALIAGPSADRVGLKTSLWVNAVVFCAGGVLSALAPSYWTLLLGRALTGIGTGSASLLSPRYSAEISPPAIRGALGTLNQVSITFGMLVAYSLGLPYEYRVDDVSLFGQRVAWWRASLLVGALIAFAHLLAATLCAESPRWLASRGRGAAAREALAKLWGGDAADGEARTRVLDPEDAGHSRLLAADEAESEAPLIDAPQGQPQEDALKLMWRPRYRLMLTLAVGMQVFQQLGGINSVLFYSSDVLQKCGLASPVWGTVLIGAVNLGGALLAGALVDNCGRRPLWIGSHAGCAVALAALAATVTTFGFSGAPIIATACILLFVAAFAIGAGPVTWVYLGEILPSEIKGPVAALAVSLNWVCNIAIAQLVPLAVQTIGVGPTYAIFAGVNVFAVVFGLAHVVETSQKPLEDIYAALYR